jgi:hypothetical protein
MAKSFTARLDAARRAGNAAALCSCERSRCAECISPKILPIATPATVAITSQAIAGISINFCLARCKISATTATRRRSSAATARRSMTMTGRSIRTTGPIARPGKHFSGRWEKLPVWEFQTSGQPRRASLASQAQVRFRGEADMNRRQEPTESVENASNRTGAARS